MSLSKANKALVRAKWGDELYDAIIAAENVIVTDGGVEKSLADVLLTLALKTEIPTDNSQLANGAGYQNAQQVVDAINSKIASVYKPGGSYAFAELPALTAANEGKVYNVTDAFTTTEDFLEGAGKKHKAGADVAIVAVEEEVEGETTTVYKYNVFANFVDLSGYIAKISGGTAGNLVKQTADGSIEDAGIAYGDVVTKVANPTDGDIAGLDSNGKLTDSGIAASAVSSHMGDTTKHITAAERTAWNGKAKLYVGATQPQDMQNGDIWFQTLSDSE